MEAVCEGCVFTSVLRGCNAERAGSRACPLNRSHFIGTVGPFFHFMDGKSLIEPRPLSASVPSAISLLATASRPPIHENQYLIGYSGWQPQRQHSSFFNLGAVVHCYDGWPTGMT